MSHHVYAVNDRVLYTFHPGFGGGLMKDYEWPGVIMKVSPRGRGQELQIRVGDSNGYLVVVADSGYAGLKPA